MIVDAQLFQVSGDTPLDDACIDEFDEVLHQLLFCGWGSRNDNWGRGQRGQGAREWWWLEIAVMLVLQELIIHSVILITVFCYFSEKLTSFILL